MRRFRTIKPFHVTVLFSVLLHLVFLYYLNKERGYVRILLNPGRQIEISVNLPLFSRLEYSRKKEKILTPRPPAPVPAPPVAQPVEPPPTLVTPDGEIPMDLPVQSGIISSTPSTGTASAAAPVIGNIRSLDNVGTYAPLYNPKPAYPAIALASNIEGYVELELLVNEQGFVESWKIIKVAGHPQFADEVAKVLSLWRFPPPRHQGRPVKAKFIYIVNFTLQ